ncbi:hypothetical protein AAE478_008541 [Parahypoxylon ruwenzoriense]
MPVVLETPVLRAPVGAVKLVGNPDGRGVILKETGPGPVGTRLPVDPNIVGVVILDNGNGAEALPKLLTPDAPVDRIEEATVGPEGSDGVNVDNPVPKELVVTPVCLVTDTVELGHGNGCVNCDEVKLELLDSVLFAIRELLLASPEPAPVGVPIEVKGVDVTVDWVALETVPNEAVPVGWEMDAVELVTGYGGGEEDTPGLATTLPLNPVAGSGTEELSPDTIGPVGITVDSDPGFKVPECERDPPVGTLTMDDEFVSRFEVDCDAAEGAGVKPPVMEPLENILVPELEIWVPEADRLTVAFDETGTVDIPWLVGFPPWGGWLGSKLVKLPVGISGAVEFDTG